MADFGSGILEDAKANIEKARQILSISYDSFYDIATVNHAMIAWGLEDYDQFKKICRDLLQRDLNQGNYTCFIPGLEYSAFESARQEKYDIGAQLFFNAQAIRTELSTPVPGSKEKLFQDLESNLKENLSDEKFVAARKNLIDKQDLLILAKQVVEAN
jgi:hypothetical protein